MFRKHMPKSILLASLILLIVSVQAQARGQLKVYVDPDHDGIFQKVKSYDVSYDEAVRAFIDAGGSPAKGYVGEEVVSFRKVAGVRLEGLHSWDGFLEFLDNNFGSMALDSEQLLPYCDATVQVIAGTFDWSCDDDLDCIPVEDCEGWFVWAKADFNCIDDPPCPTPLVCTKIANELHIVSFSSSPDYACVCDEADNCVKGDVTSVSNIVFDNDVCECYASGPSLTQWGLIILLIIMAGIATWVVLKRRRMVTA